MNFMAGILLLRGTSSAGGEALVFKVIVILVVLVCWAVKALAGSSGEAGKTERRSGLDERSQARFDQWKRDHQ